MNKSDSWCCDPFDGWTSSCSDCCWPRKWTSIKKVYMFLQQDYSLYFQRDFPLKSQCGIFILKKKKTWNKQKGKEQNNPGPYPREEPLMTISAGLRNIPYFLHKVDFLCPWPAACSLLTGLDCWLPPKDLLSKTLMLVLLTFDAILTSYFNATI